MVELAIATHTTPSAWLHEDTQTIITALDVLQRQADELRRSSRAD